MLFIRLIIFGCSLLFLDTVSNFAQKKTETEKSLKLGNIDLRYSPNLALNKIKIPRPDVATFVDTRYDDGKSFLFVIAPLKYIDGSLDAQFLAGLRDEIVKTLLKNDSPNFQWKGLENSSAISQFQVDSIRLNGWDGKVLLFFEFRRVMTKAHDFIVGMVLEQGKGSELQKYFENGNQLVLNVGGELTMAQLASSVTGEEKPVMWPPGGIKGIPVEPIRSRSKQ